MGFLDNVPIFTFIIALNENFQENLSKGKKLYLKENKIFYMKFISSYFIVKF